MRNWIRNIITWIRLARALKAFMPFDAISKADKIFPDRCQIVAAGEHGIAVDYRFYLMSDEEFFNLYKIDLH